MEVYDIANNTITNAAFIGTVGLDWQFSGVDVWQGLRARRSGYRQRTQPAGPDVLNRPRQGAKVNLDLPTEKVGDRGRAPR